MYTLYICSTQADFTSLIPTLTPRSGASHASRLLKPHTQYLSASNISSYILWYCISKHFSTATASGKKSKPLRRTVLLRSAACWYPVVLSSLTAALWVQPSLKVWNSHITCWMDSRELAVPLQMPIKITVSVQYDAVKTGMNFMTSEETAAKMETPQGIPPNVG